MGLKLLAISEAIRFEFRREGILFSHKLDPEFSKYLITNKMGKKQDMIFPRLCTLKKSWQKKEGGGGYREGATCESKQDLRKRTIVQMARCTGCSLLGVAVSTRREYSRDGLSRRAPCR